MQYAVDAHGLAPGEQAAWAIGRSLTSPAFGRAPTLAERVGRVATRCAGNGEGVLGALTLGRAPVTVAVRLWPRRMRRGDSAAGIATAHTGASRGDGGVAGAHPDAQWARRGARSASAITRSTDSREGRVSATPSPPCGGRYAMPFLHAATVALLSVAPPLLCYRARLCVLGRAAPSSCARPDYKDTLWLIGAALVANVSVGFGKVDLPLPPCPRLGLTALAPSAGRARRLGVLLCLARGRCFYRFARLRGAALPPVATHVALYGARSWFRVELGGLSCATPACVRCPCNWSCTLHRVVTGVTCLGVLRRLR